MMDLRKKVLNRRETLEYFKAKKRYRNNIKSTKYGQSHLVPFLDKFIESKLRFGQAIVKLNGIEIGRIKGIVNVEYQEARIKSDKPWPYTLNELLQSKND